MKSDLQKVMDSIAEGDGLSTTLLKHEPPVKCPHCGEELTSICAARSVELQKEGDKWIEKNVFSAACSCPNCYEELGVETLDELGVPNEYR